MIELESINQLSPLAYFKKIFFLFFSCSWVIIFFAIGCIFLEYQIPGSYKNYFHQSFNMIESFQSVLFFIGVTYLYFLVLPYFFSKLILKEKLIHLGFCWPNKNIAAWSLFVILLPICTALIVWLSRFSSFQQYYGSLKQLPAWRIFLVQPLIAIVYYVAEEFFFRGFLFLSLWKKIKWHSLWVTELMFAIAHIGKPGAEILFSIPVGIILNLLTLWSRSIVPAVIFHSVLGISLIFAFL